MSVFLSAAWHDLLLLNYRVPDEVLTPHLPPGLTLDRHEGSAYVSLVAFDFLRTRVLGIPWPGHTDFAEINLRFYVRSGELRGVSFIREIVPQHLTAFFARTLYNEPYVAAPISSRTERAGGHIAKEYVLSWRGAPQRLAVTAKDAPHRPDHGSVEHFFKEHEWGFGTSRRGKLVVYRVEHAVWDVYPVTRTDLAFDFAAVYGDKWGFLNREKPQSVAFAAGSSVKVLWSRGSTHTSWTRPRSPSDCVPRSGP